jgi:hypothetical protein
MVSMRTPADAVPASTQPTTNKHLFMTASLMAVSTDVVTRPPPPPARGGKFNL